MNSFSAFEQAALSTAIYPGQGTFLGLTYVTLKAAGEAGEFASHYLDREIDAERRTSLMAKEIGDELWYLAAKAREMGTTLAELLGFDDITGFEAFCSCRSPLGGLALIGTNLAGQFAEQLGKAIRDDASLVTAERREKLLAILADHGRNLAEKAYSLGIPLATIAEGNVAKLLDRKARGVLGGSGDNR